VDLDLPRVLEVSRKLLVQSGRLAASSSVLEVEVVAAPRHLLLYSIQTAKPTPDRAAEIKFFILSVGKKVRG
jgi:hypothetical protein